MTNHIFIKYYYHYYNCYILHNSTSHECITKGMHRTLTYIIKPVIVGHGNNSVLMVRFMNLWETYAP